MERERYRPLVDKLFWFIAVLSAVIIIPLTVFVTLDFSAVALVVVILTDILILYFLISPLFGYVELRERAVFIKFGFFLSREISYSKIRGASFERKWYSDSMLSLKCALRHVNIKYNNIDFVTVSVVDNDGFVRELFKRAENTSN
ncbi:MAG: PH domain-containing protein [Clostridia bacterium]|nr:PH domain-containing protein [Clostridia bacterium]